ncbi:hypothetical protein Sjap_009853 [Stephania japonica]|uniref:Uncharacterized protein n=1 Tax=Stephania japonica TaxID=461633 RepID=A0AAP0J8F7_9MAGN
MKLVEGKGLWKRVVRLLKLRNHEKLIIRCNVLESIAKVQGGAAFDNGKVKMRIVIRKDELQHMLVGRKDGSYASPRELVLTAPSSFPLTLEQRLQFMRRRHFRRADSMKEGCCPWKPVLQSIPEEL